MFDLGNKNFVVVKLLLQVLSFLALLVPQKFNLRYFGLLLTL